MEAADLLIANAAELLTCRAGERGARGAALASLDAIPDGAVAVRDGRILAVGPTAELSGRYQAATVIDAGGKLVTPGLVDAHTHLVHAGSRHTEWEARVLDRPFVGAAGIAATVARTRAADPAELRARALADLDVMLAHGTTTVEAKSGYGLDRDTELSLLEITAGLDHPADVVVTFLGAHVLPPEFARDRAGYVDLVIEMLPEARRYAQYCDVWCDPVAFTAKEARRIARAARLQGFKLRVHADQTDRAGGALLATELGASSADHLDFLDVTDLEALAASPTVAVLLPGVTHHRLELVPPVSESGDPERPWWPFAVRELVDSGACVAIASDYNPGTCPCPSLQAAMQLATRLYRLSYAEVWHAATINAAIALDRGHDRGSLEPGKRADVVVWSVPEHGMVINRFGVNLVDTVVKDGQVVRS